MESEIALTAVFIIVLVVVSTAKSALDELSDVSLRLLAGENDASPHAGFWRSVLDNYPQFRFTLTFGIHLSIASIAILLSSISYRLFPPYFLAPAFGGMLLTVVLFRQVVPMLLVQNHPERVLLRLRGPLKALRPFLAIIATPIYTALSKLQRAAAAESDGESAAGDGAEELQAFIDVGEEEGIIEETEGEMIQSIVRFGDRTVGEVMTHRPHIVAVEAGDTLEAVRDRMIESKYSRLPVYRDQIDNIEGVIYVRDLLGYWANGEVGRTAGEVARQTYFVPETKPTAELLPEMRKTRTQMALVIDEFGGLAGLVTLEDLIEEIVGEIEDEDEPEPHETEVEIVAEDAGGYVVRGQVEIGKIERLFDAELAADDFTTVAGLVINQLGRLPAVGEALEFRALRFEVVEADERRVSRVRIRRAQTNDEQEFVAPPANGKLSPSLPAA